eukprot:15176477-Alexandrium_andersonii.AAC.1
MARASTSSPVGRGLSSHDGPNGPLGGSESAVIRSPPHNADPGASGRGSSELLQIPSCGEGHLAHRASWDGELQAGFLRPGPMLTEELNDGIGAGAYGN